MKEILLGMATKDIYFQYKEIPRDLIKPHQFVLVSLIETIDPYQKQTTSYKIENENLKMQIENLSDKIQQ